MGEEKKEEGGKCGEGVCGGGETECCGGTGEGQCGGQVCGGKGDHHHHEEEEEKAVALHVDGARLRRERFAKLTLGIGIGTGVTMIVMAALVFAKNRKR